MKESIGNLMCFVREDFEAVANSFIFIEFLVSMIKAFSILYQIYVHARARAVTLMYSRKIRAFISSIAAQIVMADYEYFIRDNRKIGVT